MKDKELINNWLGEHNLSLSNSQIDTCLNYLEMIRDASDRMNLVSKNDLPNLIERHLLDCLYALTVYDIPHGAKVADLGSGAGLPGIPVAIARPDLQVYLIESRRMKSLFLRDVITRLNLANAIVIHDRWENQSLLYDVILARAVFKETELHAKVMPRISPHGVILYFAKFNDVKVLKK